MPTETLVTQVKTSQWGTMPTGSAVHLFTLTNACAEISISNFGARIISVRTPCRSGVMGEITLGSDDLAVYLADRKTYMGAIVGRYANRIANGQFSFGDTCYQVPQNDGLNCLHGGPEGFDQKLWTASTVPDGVTMSYLSPNGEMGFPGNMNVTVTYTLTENRLHVRYSATSDQPTAVNLTNHAYWDLSAANTGLATHSLQLNADAITPVDATLIPTGQHMSVSGSPFDFRAHKPFDTTWDADHHQLELAGGYDHNWILNSNGRAPTFAAEVTESTSGRTLRILTTEPGIQFYSGNFLDGSFLGRGGQSYAKRSGFCLETQHFPDSPNQPTFPSTELRPEKPFQSDTIFVFNEGLS